MSPRKKFAEFRDRAHSDRRRRARIDRARRAAIEELATYRIAELRRALGLSQEELAALIGKSQSAVSQIENGSIALSVDLLRSIVQQLGGTLEISAVFDERRIMLEA